MDSRDSLESSENKMSLLSRNNKQIKKGVVLALIKTHCIAMVKNLFQ